MPKQKPQTDISTNLILPNDPVLIYAIGQGVAALHGIIPSWGIMPTQYKGGKQYAITRDNDTMTVVISADPFVAANNQTARHDAFGALGRAKTHYKAIKDAYDITKAAYDQAVAHIQYQTFPEDKARSETVAKSWELSLDDAQKELEAAEASLKDAKTKYEEASNFEEIKPETLTFDLSKYVDA